MSRKRRRSPRREVGAFFRPLTRLLVVGLLVQSGPMQLLPAVEATPAPQRRVVVPATGPPASGVPTVRVEGQPRGVFGLAPVEEWTVFVAVDPVLSSPAGAELAGALLSANAERLAQLGSVGVVTVDTLITERLAPSRDVASIRAALESIRGIGRFDEQLARWQREALVDWLLHEDTTGAKALFLLQDAFVSASPTTGPAGEQQSAGPVRDDRALATAAAAAGWVVFPLSLGDAPEGAGPGLSALAGETGGRVITAAPEMEEALNSLANAIAIDFDLAAAPTGPLRLEVDGGSDGATPPKWTSGAFLPGQAAARARSFMGEDANGGLDVEAGIHYDGSDSRSVVLETRADFSAGAPPSSAWLSVALYLDQHDGPPRQIELQGNNQALDGVDRWVTQIALDLPEDPGELVAVVSDGLTGRWGAARVDEEGGYPMRPGPGLAVEQFDLRPQQQVRESAADTPTVITLLAPSGASLKGRQRFRTLVTTPIVRKAVFTLDGSVVAEDTDPPFAARIDLGSSVGRHTIRVDAYDGRGDIIGSDSIRLNEPTRSFDVQLSSVVIAEPDLTIEATVSHPTDVPIDRVEFYYNEKLLDTIQAAPWSLRTTIETIGQTDYVRVVAYFDDGRFLEDVQLLSTLGTAEEVEVNLVQVYVVATDKQGQPVADLSADDFEIKLRGKRQQIDRFAYADEVPLALSVVIDSSGSMMRLMRDAKRAAARFLTQVLTDNDQATVIDFDDQPRVAMPLTNDLGELLISLGALVAEEQAATALYDSVIFGALELPSGQGRKAVVLLTDGDDTRSRFSLGRAIDTAKESGLPVYVVSLAGIHDPRAMKKTDIDALTHQTGGESFYIDAMADLPRTYDHIARELRSQYLLAFPTTSQLSERDIESIKVEVKRPGIKLRTVVGGRSVD